MRARLAALPFRALLGLAIAGVLVYAIALWFLVVAPRRADAAALSADIAAAELELAQARGGAVRPSAGGAPVADVFRLAKAMPSVADQPGLVLELDRLARSTGVKLGSIAPAEPSVAASGATSIPVTLVVTGSYRQLTRYLARVRGLVVLRRGRLRATGRLFTIEGVVLAESIRGGFPLLDATITLNAYVYDGPIVPAKPAKPAEELPATGTSAAGATP